MNPPSSASLLNADVCVCVCVCANTHSVHAGALTPHQVVWNSPSGISHRIGVPVSTVTVYPATENSGMQKHGVRSRDREIISLIYEGLDKNYDSIKAHIPVCGCFQKRPAVNHCQETCQKSSCVLNPYIFKK